MKTIFCICSIVLLSNICIAEDYSDDSPNTYTGNKNDETSSEPIVYADISQGAIDKASSPDGVYALMGLGFGSQEYSASIKDNGNYTKNDMNIFSVIAGIGYNKSLKHNIVIGIDAIINLSKKKKKLGDWNTLNSAYNSAIQGIGNRDGKLETDLLTPSVGMKCGYFLQKHKTVIFGKFGMSMLTGTYDYYLGTNRNANIKVRSFIPSIGIGAEMKFTKKWGMQLEYNTSLNRTITKYANQYEHKIKVGKSDIRIIGIYNLSGFQGFGHGS